MIYGEIFFYLPILVTRIRVFLKIFLLIPFGKQCEEIKFHITQSKNKAKQKTTKISTHSYTYIGLAEICSSNIFVFQ